MKLIAPKTLFLDFDGVLVDSNSWKHANIEKAVSLYCSSEKSRHVVDYFIRHNGRPRREKILKFFTDEITDKILMDYASLNETTLQSVELTTGAFSFLKSANYQEISMVIVSGGELPEIKAILDNHGLSGLFDNILGSPASKLQNLQGLKAPQECLFIGDSCYDFEVSQSLQIPFLFMSEYSQWNTWREQIIPNQINRIKNLSEVIWL